MIKRIKEMVRVDRISKRKARLESAVRAKANAFGEAEYHRMMSDYYSGCVAAIDPHADWWGFADAKQKEQDNIAMFQEYSKKVSEASARIEAEQARYDEVAK